MKKFIFFLFAFSLFTFHSLYSQWYKQTIPVSKAIHGIEFIDSLKGWAVTTSAAQYDTAYVLHTTNGGTNWVVQFKSYDHDYDAFDMVNDSIGYIIGGIVSSGLPLLLKTTNSGVNWVNMNISFGIVFSDIFFPSRDTGYVSSSSSFAPGLWRTTNGGVSWQESTSGMTGTLISSLFFLNNYIGWSGTSTGIIYKTTDAGSNWTSIGSFTPGVTSIFFVNEITGWVGFTNDKLRYTSNGGSNWVLQTLPAFCCGSTSDLYFFNSQIGWGGNRGLKIIKTTDAGLLWGYQIDSATSYKLSFLDTSMGWTGSDLGIAKTTNGGGPIVGVVQISTITPKSYILYQNYPNPFNSETVIRFALKKSGYAKLKIYDVLGREKTIWESGNILGAGTHEISFNAENFSSGVYFYQLTIINEQLAVVYKETRKMVLVK